MQQPGDIDRALEMKPALLLVDIQNDFLERAGMVPERIVFLERAEKWLTYFRGANLPVVHVRTLVRADGTDRMPHWIENGTWSCVSGSFGCQAPIEFAERDGERVFDKSFHSGFQNAALVEALRSDRIDTVVVAGLFTHACVRATALDAYARGFAVRIARDAVASTEPVHAAMTIDYLSRHGIDGVDLEWVSTAAGDRSRSTSAETKTWELRNPARCDEVLDEVPIAGIDEARLSAVRAGHKQVPWASSGLAQRKAQLVRWGDAVAARRQDLISRIVTDIGKPVAYAEAEFEYALQLIRHTLETLDNEVDPGRGFSVRYAPLGTVGIITPWNNPLAIPIGKIAPALGWGNGVVWKPALPGTRVARLLLQLLANAAPGAPVELLTGDAATGSALLSTGLLDAVSFTGSSRQGAIVANLFSDRGKPLQAELGGNNAVIVAADADFENVASRLAPALFGFAGQRCTAPRRIIVERAGRKPLERALLERIADLRLGDPREPEVQIGPLVSRARQAEMARLARNTDGHLLCGGSVPAGFAHGAWFLPTLVVDPSPDSALVQEESFGPVAVLMSADSIDHAVRLSNAVRHGLVTTVFSENDKVIRQVMDGAQSGMVAAKLAPIPIAAEAPFVGWKCSGFGPPEHGRWDRDMYSKPQARY